jgi:hypothetical protein
MRAPLEPLEPPRRSGVVVETGRLAMTVETVERMVPGETPTVTGVVQPVTNAKLATHTTAIAPPRESVRVIMPTGEAALAPKFRQMTNRCVTMRWQFCHGLARGQSVRSRRQILHAREDNLGLAPTTNGHSDAGDESDSPMLVTASLDARQLRT